MESVILCKATSINIKESYLGRLCWDIRFGLKTTGGRAEYFKFSNDTAEMLSLCFIQYVAALFTFAVHEFHDLNWFCFYESSFFSDLNQPVSIEAVGMVSQNMTAVFLSHSKQLPHITIPHCLASDIGIYYISIIESD